VAVAAAGLLASRESLEAWRVVGIAFDELGVSRTSFGGQMSGVLYAPIMVFLYVPTLVGLSALALIVMPLLLAAAVATRSQRLGVFFSGTLICCSVLLLAGLLSNGLFAEGATGLSASLSREGDAASREIAQMMGRWPGVLARALQTHMLLLLGLFAAAPFALRRRVEGGGDLAGVPAGDSGPAGPVGAPSVSAAVITADPGAAMPASDAPSPRMTLERTFSFGGTFAVWPLLLGAIGVVMIGLGAGDLLRPRARWVGSDPAPGATVDVSPGTVRVTFDRALSPGSTIAVTRTIAADPAAPAVRLEGGIDAADPNALAAPIAADAGEGLYWVSWRAVAGAGGVARRGSFPFRIGTSVPAYHLSDAGTSGRGSDERGRKRRAVLLGGVLLVAIAALSRAARPGRARPMPPATAA
jgi:methionine-rich copper-binding protein CopC